MADDELSKLEALASQISESEDSDDSNEDDDAFVDDNLENSKLEALANQITDSEESDDSDGNIDIKYNEIEQNDTDGCITQQIRLEEIVEESQSQSLASIIQNIEDAAQTSSIVLEDNIEDGLDEDSNHNNDTSVNTWNDMANNFGNEAFDGQVIELEQGSTVSVEFEDTDDNVLCDTMDDDEPTIAEDSDSSSSDEEMPKSFESAIDFCDNYLDHLNHMLHRLTTELNANLIRQEQIEDQLFELHMQPNRSEIIKSQHPSVVKKTVTVFGYPYFKDRNVFYPPPNSDTLAKQRNKELDPWIENPRPFTKEDQQNLRLYVREAAIAKRLLPIEEEREVLNLRLRHTSKEDHQELKDRLHALIRKENELRNMPDEMLFFDRFYGDFDWDRISVAGFKSTHTPIECELQWRNLVHPEIDRGPWKPDEDQMLKRMADATGCQDWDSIARELGTMRTPIACLVRYMTRHCVTLNNRRWERSEDDRLRRLVAHCRINDFIPWAKVSYYMERRTKEQCFQRYVYSLKDTIRRGTFTDAEDMILIIGWQLYQKDWSKISEMIPYRTPVQLHCRWNSFLRCEFRVWTPDEDNRLLELVKKHGIKDWVLISAELGGGRTRGQTRGRFQQIYQSFKRNPSAKLENMKYLEIPGVNKRRQDQVHEKLASCYNEWKYKNDTSENSPTLMGNLPTDCHIMLRNGETVNSKNLRSFIRHIQTFLPAPNPPKPLPPLIKKSLRTLPDREEEVFKKPVISRVKNMGSKRGRPKGGGVRRTLPKRKEHTPSRDRIRYQAMSPLDRDIGKFFRPTWVINKRQANRMYTENELSLMGRASRVLGHHLNLEDIDWEKMEDDMEKEPREVQFLNYYKEYKKYPTTEVVDKVGNQPQVSPKPKVQKTYSRRGKGEVKQSNSRTQTPILSGSNMTSAVVPSPSGEGTSIKQSDSRTQTPSQPPDKDTMTVLPPTQASLLAFRGLQLREKYLRHKRLNQEDFNLESRDSIHADQRLVKRFLQLFLWPSKMAHVAPPKQEKLFEDSSDEDIDDPDASSSSCDITPSLVTVPEPVPESLSSSDSVPRQGRGLHGVLRTVKN